MVALALNAAGASLAGWLLGRACWGPPERPYWVRALLSLVLPSIVFAGGALAGYWGFSALLFSALILLLFALAVHPGRRAVLSTPVVALVVALFRPEGVVVGGAFALLALRSAWRQQQLRPHLMVSGACAAVAVAYFIWRWSYFGLLLPLPLYVKQHAGESDADGPWSILPGLAEHWDWFTASTSPKYFVLGLAAAIVVVRLWRDEPVKRVLISLIPVGALFVILAFAVQTQNISWRFQAPAYLVLLYSVIHVAGRLIDRARGTLLKMIVTAAVLAVALPPVWASYKATRRYGAGRWRTFIESFSPRFGPLMGPETVVALTEAGALPYWTQAQIADIVGLNDPDLAVRPATVDTLRQLKPDLVFLHQGTSLMNDVLIPDDSEDARIYPMSRERLDAALRPSRRDIVERVPASYDQIGLMNVQYAPSVMIKYLTESDEYDLFVVDGNGARTYLHVFGLRRSWPLRDAAVEALYWSVVPENYRSYLDLKRERRERQQAAAR